MIGNGLKLTFFARLVITGNEAIPNVDTIMHKINYPNLVFTYTPDNLIDFDQDTGIFTFNPFAWFLSTKGFIISTAING